MRIRIERRLNQPRWLTVAVPVASVLVAFVLGGIVLLITGHNPLTTYKQLFEAGLFVLLALFVVALAVWFIRRTPA